VNLLLSEDFSSHRVELWVNRGIRPPPAHEFFKSVVSFSRLKYMLHSPTIALIGSAHTHVEVLYLSSTGLAGSMMSSGVTALALNACNSGNDGLLQSCSRAPARVLASSARTADGPAGIMLDESITSEASNEQERPRTRQRWHRESPCSDDGSHRVLCFLQDTQADCVFGRLERSLFALLVPSLLLVLARFMVATVGMSEGN
jgi:hypothetical protein